MTKLSRILRQSRRAAGLEPADIERRTRGCITSAQVMALEFGADRYPPPAELRLLAQLYQITAWSLLEAAGYVTPADALDGIAAARKARRVA